MESKSFATGAVFTEAPAFFSNADPSSRIERTNFTHVNFVYYPANSRHYVLYTILLRSSVNFVSFGNLFDDVHEKNNLL